MERLCDETWSTQQARFCSCSTLRARSRDQTRALCLADNGSRSTDLQTRTFVTSVKLHVHIGMHLNYNICPWMSICSLCIGMYYTMYWWYVLVICHSIENIPACIEYQQACSIYQPVLVCIHLVFGTY